MQRSRSPQPSMSRETKVRRQHAVTHPRPGAELWQGYFCVPLLGHLLWCCILGPWYTYHTPFMFRDWIVIVGCNTQFTESLSPLNGSLCYKGIYIPDHLLLFYWTWMKPRNEAEEAVVGGLLTLNINWKGRQWLVGCWLLTSTGRDFCHCQANDFQTRSHVHIVVQVSHDCHMSVTWWSHPYCHRCCRVLWQRCRDCHTGVSFRASVGVRGGGSGHPVHGDPQWPDARILQLKVHPPWPPGGREICSCHSVWGRILISDHSQRVHSTSHESLPGCLPSLLCHLTY